MWKMKQNLFLELLFAAKRKYPKEFLCFLGGNSKNKTITEFIFIPNEANENSTYFLEHTIPFDETIIGTIHSHPTNNTNPSKEDKKVFQKYQINIILSFPFQKENYKVYNQKAEQIQLEFF